MRIRLKVCPIPALQAAPITDEEADIGPSGAAGVHPFPVEGQPSLCAALALTVTAGMSGCMGQGGKVRLFERGEGRVYGDGWVGMVAPAAFLSEQEHARSSSRRQRPGASF